MKFAVLVLGMAILGSTAQARDLFNFHSLGFSKDGRFYAFAESVVQDGSGFPEAKVVVVDVKKNVEVLVKRVVLDDDKTEKIALGLALRGAKLSQFGIEVGLNTGKTLLQRVLNDRSNYTDTLFSTGFYQIYRLNITPVRLVGTHTCLFEAPELLHLSVKSEDPEAKIDSLLQADQVLPHARRCAHEYQVARVYKYADQLVVIMTYKTDGFEGDDMHHMAVTASINLP